MLMAPPLLHTKAFIARYAADSAIIVCYADASHAMLITPATALRSLYFADIR